MVDAMIRLFEDDAMTFTSNGIGYLPDATVCKVTEERNGAFELMMKYPIKGIRYSELKFRRIIVAKPNPYDDPQPFRIYNISKPISGIVTINAEHISYDLSGYPVIPFEASSAADALFGLKVHSAVDCPFDFWTDKTTTGNFKIETPLNMRSCLGGIEGSILDIYGTGEYEFDKYDVKLYLHRGTDRGVTLRYGKNITDLEQEENNANVYTGVYPYWYSEEDGLVNADPQIISGPGTYNYEKIYILDMSYEWTEKPTPEELTAAAEKYITNNNIGVPKVSLNVSFVHLSDSEEYADFRGLETVHLCDTVSVIFEDLGVNASSKCIKTVYDCLTNKYDSISLGDHKTNLADTIAGTSAETDKKIENQKSFLEKSVAEATAKITGNLGGYVVLHSSTGAKEPDEILIMDTPDIDTALSVWRWNNAGLGYSSNGYNGPYETAITGDGQIVADFITTGEMLANRIRGGTLIMGGIDNAGGVVHLMTGDNELDGEWTNNGLRLHKSPLCVYGILSTSTGTTNLNVESKYAGTCLGLFINNNEVYFQGMGGDSNANNLVYTQVVKDPIKGLILSKNTSSGVSPCFVVNNGINYLNYKESMLVLNTIRLGLGVVLGTGNVQLHGLTVSGKNYCYVQNGGLYAQGDIICSGDKNRVVETMHYGNRLLNAMESPEPRFFDFGSCTVGFSGSIRCEIDPVFLETIESEQQYQVFLTRTNQQTPSNKEPWVEKFKGYFIVHGTSGSKYDYMVSAIQKDRAGIRLREVEEIIPEEVDEDGNRNVFTIDI